MAKNKQQIEETSQPNSTVTDDASLRRDSSSNPDTDAPLRRRNDPFLIVCRCFSLITALCAILCIAVNVLSAVRSFMKGSDVFDGIFRCYAAAIAVLTVVAETEWAAVLKFWKVLEYWAGRGMLQIFVAVMTRAFPDYNGQRKDLVLLQNIASYLLLSCGVVYLISYGGGETGECRSCFLMHKEPVFWIFWGILCIGFLKRKLQQKETTRDQAVRDLEELERKRNELEALLIE